MRPTLGMSLFPSRAGVLSVSVHMNMSRNCLPHCGKSKQQLKDLSLMPGQNTVGESTAPFVERSRGPETVTTSEAQESTTAERSSTMMTSCSQRTGNCFNTAVVSRAHIWNLESVCLQ